MLIPIIVDDRERCGGVMEALLKSQQFDVKVQRLGVGDYKVGKRFLFERKTLSDLVTSIISGRLFKQASRLTEQPHVTSILILEGTAKDLSESRMSWESIQGALVTVSVFFGVPILRTRNPEETIKTFNYVVQQSQVIAKGGLPRMGCRPKDKDALRRHILQGLPGVGPTRAEGLLAQFGNIESIINADQDSLTTVPGLGQQTAKKIRWAVTEQKGLYSLAV